MTFATFLAEDEPLALDRLRELVASVPWLRIVGEARDGVAAARLVEELRPRLLFLDIRMPGLSGLEVLEALSYEPAVVFTTAHDRYAVSAFDVQAADFLLKPFGADRFAQSLRRVRRRLEGEPATVGDSSTAAPPASPRALETSGDGRLFLRSGDDVLVLDPGSIERLQARDEGVLVYVGGEPHAVQAPLQRLVERLDPGTFLQVHRGHVVNLDFVERMQPFDGSRFEVILRDGTRVVASRERSKVLRGRVV